MRIYSEQHLSRFTAWAGAKDTMWNLTFKQLDELNNIIEELYPDGIDETELNDLLWFERDAIAEWLGFADWEALLKANEEAENG